jgi:small basic protein (TIGR04137 family)
MSQHPSYRKGQSSASKKRSVLKRFERVDLLVKRGAWPEGRTRVTNLPKTKPEE